SLWGSLGPFSTASTDAGGDGGEPLAGGLAGAPATVIGVIDSGIDYRHPDLYLNIWLNQLEIPAALIGALVDADADGMISFRDLNAVANASLTRDFNGNGYIDAGDLLSDARWED